MLWAEQPCGVAGKARGREPRLVYDAAALGKAHHRPLRTGSRNPALPTAGRGSACANPSPFGREERSALELSAPDQSVIPESSLHLLCIYRPLVGKSRGDGTVEKAGWENLISAMQRRIFLPAY